LAFPRSHIQDFRVVTDFDGDYKDATLSVTLSVAGEPANAHITLYGQDKKTIIAKSLQTLPPFANELVVSIPVKSPQQWSAETPVLYHLVIQYGSQVIASRVGFRKVEIKDGLIKVNGSRVVFRGANRHEHHPRHGRSVPYEFLRQDLLMMKRHNINSIRTCHQPSDRRLYDLADELGLWVMDEADMECHGWEKVHQCALSKTERLLEVEERRLLAFGRAGRWLSDNPDWEEAYIDRAHQLVSRDKNHACVVIWSLGNEAFEGRNIEAMYKWVKAYDPTRPIHYEGDYSNRYADLRSTMYPPLNKLVEFVEDWDGKKPLLLCEFIHSMGNGPGNIKEYIDLFHKYPCLQGGWVWEWANHGLVTKSEEGTEFMGYGGDFGEAHHDGHFVIDGIVASNHRPQPALLEYAKALEPIQLSSRPSMESIQIANYYDFIDLNHLECSCKVIGDGCSNDETVVPLPALPAGQTAWMSLSAITSSITPRRGERYLEIIFRLKESTTWADAGHEIAWLQIPISASVQQVPSGVTYILSVTQESPTMLGINSPHMKWTFDLLRGRLVSWKKDNRNILHTGPSLSFYRAPTDNDITAGAEWTEKEVKRLKTYTRKVTWSIDASTGAVEIACVQRVAPVSLEWCFNTTTTYTFRDSQVAIHVTGKPNGINTPKILPRVGLEMALVSDFETATWFGRGPGESYKDKKHSQRFGRWSLPIEDLMPMYEFPQESGNHTETQWVQFEGAGADAPSLRAAFPHRSQGFDFQASHYCVFDVERAQHPYELMKKRLEEIIVRLDIDHHGLGSESCGECSLLFRLCRVY
jgi:beta-galactosidase